MIHIQATIQIDESELAAADATVKQLVEGIHARLHPVVSCDPDETISTSVEVTQVFPSSPISGLYSSIAVNVGVAASPGPWRLHHIGFGQWGYVHEITGNFVAVEAVKQATR